MLPTPTAQASKHGSYSGHDSKLIWEESMGSTCQCLGKVASLPLDVGSNSLDQPPIPYINAANDND